MLGSECVSACGNVQAQETWEYTDQEDTTTCVCVCARAREEKNDRALEDRALEVNIPTRVCVCVRARVSVCGPENEGP